MPSGSWRRMYGITMSRCHPRRVVLVMGDLVDEREEHPRAQVGLEEPPGGALGIEDEPEQADLRAVRRVCPGHADPPGSRDELCAATADERIRLLVVFLVMAPQAQLDRREAVQGPSGEQSHDLPQVVRRGGVGDVFACLHHVDRDRIRRGVDDRRSLAPLLVHALFRKAFAVKVPA